VSANGALDDLSLRPSWLLHKLARLRSSAAASESALIIGRRSGLMALQVLEVSPPYGWYGPSCATA
jgi:hypothetical protein